MLQYLNIEISDLPELTSIYRRYLNDGESIERQLERGMTSGGFIGVKCVADGEICGVFSAFKGIEFTCGHDELVKSLKDKYKDAVIYTTEMIVVLPNFRHQGIAHEMVKRFKEQINQTNAEYLLIELWRKPSGRVPGRVVLNVLGGEVEYAHYPMFYKDLSKYELTCPICGVACICGADISMLKLTGIEKGDEYDS